MENAFKAIMGDGDEGGKVKARDFVDRVTTGDPLSGFNDDEVRESASVLQQLSPEQRQRALAASVQNVKSNMKESDRSSLNDMLKQRQSGEGMVDITRSGENVQPGARTSSEPASGGIDDLLGGLLGGGAGGSGGGSGGGGLDDLLGGLLGGGGGGDKGKSGGSGGGLGDILGGLLGGGGGDKGKSGGGGLGDMLGGLLGGGGDDTPTRDTPTRDTPRGGTQSGAVDAGGGLGGALGDVMSGPMGKAIIAGAAAYAMKEFLD